MGKYDELVTERYLFNGIITPEHYEQIKGVQDLFGGARFNYSIKSVPEGNKTTKWHMDDEYEGKLVLFMTNVFRDVKIVGRCLSEMEKRETKKFRKKG